MSLKENLKKNWIKYATYGLATIGVIAAGYAAKFSFDSFALKDQIDEYNKKKQTFNEVYTDTLYEYGDLNNDGFISPDERFTLEKKVLQDKNVNYVYGESVHYKNGKSVPVETLTDWFKNYKE